MKKTARSFVVEAALAGLFAAVAAAPAAADHHEKGAGKESPKAAKKMGKGAAKAAAAPVQCLGVNACKGKSECGVDGKHACGGQNACKGQGWISLTKKACAKKKGTVMAAAAPMAAPAAK